MSAAEPEEIKMASPPPHTEIEGAPSVVMEAVEAVNGSMEVSTANGAASSAAAADDEEFATPPPKGDANGMVDADTLNGTKRQSRSTPTPNDSPVELKSKRRKKAEDKDASSARQPETPKAAAAKADTAAAASADSPASSSSGDSDASPKADAGTDDEDMAKVPAAEAEADAPAVADVDMPAAAPATDEPSSSSSSASSSSSSSPKAPASPEGEPKTVVGEPGAAAAANGTDSSKATPKPNGAPAAAAADTHESESPEPKKVADEESKKSENGEEGESSSASSSASAKAPDAAAATTSSSSGSSATGFGYIASFEDYMNNADSTSSSSGFGASLGGADDPPAWASASTDVGSGSSFLSASNEPGASLNGSGTSFGFGAQPSPFKSAAVQKAAAFGAGFKRPVFTNGGFGEGGGLFGSSADSGTGGLLGSTAETPAASSSSSSSSSSVFRSPRAPFATPKPTQPGAAANGGSNIFPASPSSPVVGESSSAVSPTSLSRSAPEPSAELPLKDLYGDFDIVLAHHEPQRPGESRYTDCDRTEARVRRRAFECHIHRLHTSKDEKAKSSFKRVGPGLAKLHLLVTDKPGEDPTGRLVARDVTTKRVHFHAYIPANVTYELRDQYHVQFYTKNVADGIPDEDREFALFLLKTKPRDKVTALLRELERLRDIVQKKIPVPSKTHAQI